jgi:hypothetical protein
LLVQGDNSTRKEAGDFNVQYAASSGTYGGEEGGAAEEGYAAPAEEGYAEEGAAEGYAEEGGYEEVLAFAWSSNRCRVLSGCVCRDTERTAPRVV